jgi:hypothetical protein
MINYYDRLKSCLERGFYADNFAEIYGIAFEAAGLLSRPLGFYLIWSIFRSLDDWWRDRPLTETTSELMEHALIPPVTDYLVAAASGISPEVELEHLNAIAAAYRAWIDVQEDIPRGQ